MNSNSFFRRRALLCSLLSFTLAGCQAADSKAPEEVGTVKWGRDMDEALRASAVSGKPVFALFQEVPGCAGCKQFGREVLSDAALVAVIHESFTPVLIHNNAGGSDAATLKKYNEPAWNFQVVRFLNAQGADLIPRQDRVWETAPLARRMAAALKAAGRPVPAGLAQGAPAPEIKRAAFAMACFWTGEMKLGQIEGVQTTEAGFIGGREVTLVSYDPARLPLPRLAAAAEKVECAQAVFVPEADRAELNATRLTVAALTGYRAAPAGDQKKQLQGTPAARLTLTPEQATKLNAWLRVDAEKARSFLTKEQRAALGN